MFFCRAIRNSNPGYRVYPLKINPLLSPAFRRGWNCARTWRCKLRQGFSLNTLAMGGQDLCSGSKETADQSECEARKHGEGEAGKPSSLGLSLQPPCVSFEPACFLRGLCASSPAPGGTGERSCLSVLICVPILQNFILPSSYSVY